MAFDDIRERAAREREDLNVPGVALGILTDDDEHAVGLGVTSLENPLEVTPDTLFQTGSITKTITATAVVRLVEGGKLALDDPVRSYLPELRLADEETSSRVTLRHVLTHTGGWAGDHFRDFGRGDDALARIVESLSEVHQQTPLGELWSYNNSGFYLAGRAIEVVTGRPFEAAIRELVLEPLGLEQSFFFPDEVITRRFAVGHEPTENGKVAVAREWWIGRASHPAGGVVSTVRDLFRYARFAFDGQPLLSAASWAELTSPQAPIGGDVDAVGLAWMLKEIDGVRLISHSGGTKGQVSWLCVAPERRFAFVCLTNHSYGGVLIDRVARQALEEFLGLRWPDPEPAAREAGRLAEFAGRYTSQMSDAELAVSDGGLELRLLPKSGFPTPETPPPPPPPPASLAFYDDDWTIATDELWKGSHVGFLRGPDGEILWMRLGGRLYARA